MNKMSTKHLMFLIIAVSIIGLRSYSSIFINYGGRDSGIAAIFACILIYLYLVYLMKLFKRGGNYNFRDIINNSFPKILGKCIIFIFSIALFLSAIESAAIESSSIHTNFFLSTPTWYCLLFILIPGGYILTRDFNSILITTISSVFLVLIGDSMLFLLMAKYLDFSFLLPILENGFDKNLWICLLLIVCSFSSVAIVLPYLNNIEKDKYLIKYSSLAILICSILVTVSFISIITFFGPERAANIFYPEYVASQRVQIASFLEFGEIFYIFRSVFMWLLKYILSSYGIILLYKDIIKNKKLFIVFYSTIVFIASYLLNKNQFFLFNTLEILQFITGAIYIIIPILCLLVYNFKSKVRKKA